MLASLLGLRYQRTMSDIAGKDAYGHGNDPLKAIECVRRFLNNKERGQLPGATIMKKRFQAFSVVLPAIATHVSQMNCEVWNTGAISCKLLWSVSQK